ncbi:hypothetical protein, partial [Burkholderia pseudomallei]|uniref:hypothetical protein n=1 Tax=Burkholderia pseudomallei TaxID=28450 RepID=UPI001C4D350B
TPRAATATATAHRTSSHRLATRRADAHADAAPPAPPAARESVAESAFESVLRGKTARAARVGRISTSGCPFSTGAPFYGQRCWAAPASAGGSAGGTRPARPRRANPPRRTR